MTEFQIYTPKTLGDLNAVKFTGSYDDLQAIHDWFVSQIASDEDASVMLNLFEKVLYYTKGDRTVPIEYDNYFYFDANGDLQRMYGWIFEALYEPQ